MFSVQVSWKVYRLKFWLSLRKRTKGRLQVNSYGICRCYVHSHAHCVIYLWALTPGTSRQAKPREAMSKDAEHADTGTYPCQWLCHTKIADRTSLWRRNNTSMTQTLCFSPLKVRLMYAPVHGVGSVQAPSQLASEGVYMAITVSLSNMQVLLHMADTRRTFQRRYA